MRKLLNTLNICFTLFMARMFGRYEHTAYNGELAYHKYKWRGNSWCFPKEPLED